MKPKRKASVRPARRQPPAPAGGSAQDVGDAQQPMLAELRRRAEAAVSAQREQPAATSVASRTDADTARLLHELQVHQVELELQNTELQQSRDEIEDSLERYADLYDFAPVGYFTLSIEGAILQVNLTGARMVGQGRAGLIGQSFERLVAVACRPAFRDFLKRVFAGHAKQSGDFELPGAGPPLRTVNIEAQFPANGRECRMAVMDITERKQVENKVGVSEVRYRRLFEAAHDGVLLLDPATRKITDANPFMTRLLGYSKEELCGKELFEIGLLRDEVASQEMFRKLKLRHKVRYEDLPLLSREGRHQEVEVVANLYQENDHAVIQCNIRDITDRKKAEETRRRLEMLGASNRKLEEEIVRRRAMEKSLQKSEHHQRHLLAESRKMQVQLRSLSHQILQAQEEERKRISRELHDDISQTLVNISVHLESLVQEARLNPQRLKRQIARTRKLVERSIDIVHRFARDLRPSALDHLGLISTLQSSMTEFMQRTGVRVRFTAFAGVERLNSARRTVLYRVVQSALSNVARHAGASRVDVHIQKCRDHVCMTIQDNGKSFDTARPRFRKGGRCLGLLGMRERLEMVGGCFEIRSAPGAGTTVEARIPLGRKTTNGGEGDGLEGGV
ncbi:MAG TPA: PAS domain-containing sensor histidine kinase [Methylomirabilota bacterium]|nr:PAS domain-containing sensor histidine kinase [Methylomirabilota bacterium]